MMHSTSQLKRSIRNSEMPRHKAKSQTGSFADSLMTAIYSA